FDLVATEGTARALRRSGIKAEIVYRLGDDRGPNAIDLIENLRLDLIINTPSGPQPRDDERRIRACAAQHGVPCITTIAGASVAVLAVEALQRGDLDVRTLQEYNYDVHGGESPMPYLDRSAAGHAASRPPPPPGSTGNCRT
ncbi:MAG: carbamoyl-phosphate synthase large subunit, partial [Armatimonadota bacterium]